MWFPSILSCRTKDCSELENLVKGNKNGGAHDSLSGVLKVVEKTDLCRKNAGDCHSWATVQISTDCFQGTVYRDTRSGTDNLRAWIGNSVTWLGPVSLTPWPSALLPPHDCVISPILYSIQTQNLISTHLQINHQWSWLWNLGGSSSPMTISPSTTLQWEVPIPTDPVQQCLHWIGSTNTRRCKTRATMIIRGPV